METFLVASNPGSTPSVKDSGHDPLSALGYKQSHVSANGRLRTSKERATPIQGSYSPLPYKQKVAASTSGHFCVEKTI
jgi:hypothetical protein